MSIRKSVAKGCGMSINTQSSTATICMRLKLTVLEKSEPVQETDRYISNHADRMRINIQISDRTPGQFL